MGTFFRVPVARIIVFKGLYWGPPILGNDHVGFLQTSILRVLLLGFLCNICGDGGFPVCVVSALGKLSCKPLNDKPLAKVLVSGA